MEERNELRIIAALLGVLTAIAVAATLMWIRPVVLPFVLALFGAFAAEPAVRMLRKIKIPRPVGALLVVGVVFLGLHGAGAMVAGAAGEFEERIPIYAASLQAALESLPLPGGEDAQILRLQDGDFWSEMLPFESLVGKVGSVATAVTSFAANLLLVLLLMIALIIGRQRVDQRLDAALSGATGSEDRAAVLIATIDVGIQHYMLLKTLLSLGVGFCFYAVLAVFGVDFAVVWGVLAFILNYIPTVGPVIATLPPVGLIFLQYGAQPGYALGVSLAAAAVPFVFGNLIEPKVFGDSLNLNFLAVLFALVLWTFLWGIAGAVLSVPIMMAISVVCREVPRLRPIHDLLRA